MKLFNLNWRVLVPVLLLVGLLLLGMIIPQCHAATLDAPYVQLSGGAAVVRGYTPVLDLTFTEPAPQLRHAFFSESFTAIGTSTFKGQAVPNNFALRGLFCDGFGRVDICLGPSWMLNYLPYNGSQFNANLQIDYRFKCGLTATYTHMSNAGARLPNLGRDIVLLGWRFH